MRHPVERVVSNYFHFRRHPDPANRCCRALMEHDLPLERFAELDGMRNLAGRYLHGKPAHAFKFIGVTERFADSLAVFAATFRCRVPRRPPRENLNPERQDVSYALPARLYRRILDLNAEDHAAYEGASKRMDEALARLAAARLAVRGEPGLVKSLCWRIRDAVFEPAPSPGAAAGGP